MEHGETAGIILAVSTASLIRRGKEASAFTNQDLLEIQEMAIQRLEEQFLKVEKELNSLKELMGIS
jgi:hypothetical protein